MQYLVHFHTDRDFFECHEVLEEHWKQSASATLRPVWVALIQLAVGLYHHRRGNQQGARKMLNSAASKLEIHKELLEGLGIDAQKLANEVRRRAEALQHGELPPYMDMSIPIKDEELLQLCKQRVQDDAKWESPSFTQGEHIIHKHLLRDRSEVVEARQRSWKKKKTERSRRL